MQEAQQNDRHGKYRNSKNTQFNFDRCRHCIDQPNAKMFQCCLHCLFLLFCQPLFSYIFFLCNTHTVQKSYSHIVRAPQLQAYTLHVACGYWLESAGTGCCPNATHRSRSLRCFGWPEVQCLKREANLLTENPTWDGHLTKRAKE